MAKPNKNSRRQQIITLAVMSAAIFPKKGRSNISAQLSEIQCSTGQRYRMETINNQVVVTRLS